MKNKNIAIIAVIIVLLMESGCSTQLQKPGDTIVPPVSEKLQEDDVKISSSLMNISNMSTLSQPSANMVYTMLDKTNAPLSIFADNKYLYILRNVKNADNDTDANNCETDKQSSVIEIYDVENGNLVRKISNKSMGMCSTFTVKDSNLYTFDVTTGRISLFSSGGILLTAYNTGLQGIHADKVAIADNQFIIIKIRENNEANSKIAVYNPDTGEVNRYGSEQFYNSPSGEIPEITDFCLFDKEMVLIGLSCGTLSLFNIESAIPEKSFVSPMIDGFMEYDGNVLYYASDGLISLSPANTANFTTIGSRRQVGRLLINDGFDWPQSKQELGSWLLNGLQMPVANENGRHYSMAKNTKYLFFLDFIPVIQGNDRQREQDFMVYRITK